MEILSRKVGKKVKWLFLLHIMLLIAAASVTYMTVIKSSGFGDLFQGLVVLFLIGTIGHTIHHHFFYESVDDNEKKDLMVIAWIAKCFIVVAAVSG